MYASAGVRVLVRVDVFSCARENICEWIFTKSNPSNPIVSLNVLLQNGVLSSLPYVALCASSISSGVIADYLINKRKIRIIVVRKLLMTIGMLYNNVRLHWNVNGLLYLLNIPIYIFRLYISIT